MNSWNPDCKISLSDSEDEDLVLMEKFYGRECILFAIDANLYNKPELFENALVMLRSAFLSGLLVNDKDLMGIVFFSTKHRREPFEPNCLEEIVVPENCSVFLPPRQLNKNIVNHLLRFVEVASIQFEELYGVSSNSNDCNFSQMLRLCVDLFQNCNDFVDSSTVVLITDNELPHPHNSECYLQALQKAADLKRKEVEFVLIPMKNDFNYNFFYKEFICLLQNIDIDCFEPCDAEKLREMLANRKLRQNFVRRSLGHFKFELTPNLILSAQYFSFFHKGKRPRKVILQRCDNALVRKSRLTQARKVSSDNSFEEYRSINIKHSSYEANFSHNIVRLSYEQFKRVRSIHSPGMMLLGFKSSSEVKYTLSTKSSNFIYPDDQQIKGSKRLFRALWERCLARKKDAVCLFMCKRQSMPRYVALTPVCKKIYSEESSLFGDGFKIIYLSCSSYIRDFDLSEWYSTENRADSNELRICEKLIKKFRLEYKSDVLCDPDLDKLQTKLLALAFNINYETFGSQYFPHPTQQDFRVNMILPKLKELFALDKESSNKRGRNGKINIENISNKEENRNKKIKSK